MEIILLVVLVIISFIGVWKFVCFLLSRASGWSRLATHYRAGSKFSGTQWTSQSGRLGWVSYRSILILGANPDGLYVAVSSFFRTGHRPLLIPWSDITTTEQKVWRFPYLNFTFAKLPAIRLRVRQEVGNQLVAMQSSPTSNSELRYAKRVTSEE